MKVIEFVDQNQISEILLTSKVLKSYDHGGRIVYICEHTKLGLIGVVSDTNEYGILCLLRNQDE